MKVLFAVSNENISEAIIKRYKDKYNELITYKNVYYFNAIIKELQTNCTYDRIVISEDLEVFSSSNELSIDKFLLNKLSRIMDEGKNSQTQATPIVFISSEKREFGSDQLKEYYNLGLYDALIGNDRTITKICELLKTPRTKREAQEYYKIEDDSSKQIVDNNPVSTTEIKNILRFYRGISNNPERYSDTFDRIVVQYNDDQLRYIIQKLPMTVKIVLEQQNQNYRNLMLGQSTESRIVIANEVKMNEQKKEKAINEKSVSSQEANQNMNKNEEIVENKEKEINKHDEAKKEELDQKENKMAETKELEDVNVEKNNEELKLGEEKVAEINIEEKKEEPSNQDDILAEFREQLEFSSNEAEKLNKNPFNINTSEHEIKEENEEKSETLETKDLNNQVKEEKTSNIETAEVNLDKINNERQEENISESVDQTEKLIGNIDLLKEEKKEETNDSIVSSNQQMTFEKKEYLEPNIDIDNLKNPNQIDNKVYKIPELSEYKGPNKKIVSFVGTSKNGTSFLINSVGMLLSSVGFNVAILDMTTNRNSYYIATASDKDLKNKAANCFEQLQKGIADGINISKTLTVYTSEPDNGRIYTDAESMYKTLLTEHDLILVDTDFNTNFSFFAGSNEIFIVQSLDILTMQALTRFLKELKDEKLINNDNIKVVINKEMPLKGVSRKVILGGISTYNNPSMSYMTKLFDRDKVVSCAIPFDQVVYQSYLENIIYCKYDISGYPKKFIENLKILVGLVYPRYKAGNQISEREEILGSDLNIEEGKFHSFDNNLNQTNTPSMQNNINNQSNKNNQINIAPNNVNIPNNINNQGQFGNNINSSNPNTQIQTNMNQMEMGGFYGFKHRQPGQNYQIDTNMRNDNYNFETKYNWNNPNNMPAVNNNGMNNIEYNYSPNSNNGTIPRRVNNYRYYENPNMHEYSNFTNGQDNGEDQKFTDKIANSLKKMREKFNKF